MNLLSLVVLCLISTITASALPKTQKTKGKPKAPEFPFPIQGKEAIPYDSATPVYVFDGIDYDELPRNFRDHHYTCEGEYINCIRNSNYFNIVCMYAYWLGYGNYYSLCELELRNCHTRMNSYQGLYGNHYANDLALYQGEGYDCGHSQNIRETRRFAIMDVFVVPFRPFKVIYPVRNGQNSTKIIHKTD